MKIRKATKKDLSILKKKLFNPELPWLHEKNLEKQKRKDSFWIIIWSEKEPLAHIQITFKNPEIKEIKKQIKTCPHVSTLYVREKYRRKGIATKLMKFVEQLVKKKGFSKIGLSVEKDNKFLNNLYTKMNYRNWRKGIVIDSWMELDSKGKNKKVNEKCNYLIKELK